MKLSKFAVTGLIYFFSFSIHAQSQADLKKQISNIALEIRQQSVATTASKDNLLQARALLQDALDLITQQNNGGTNKDCIDFSYQKYYLSMSSDLATEKAIAACKIIKDLDVAKFVYEKYYLSNSSTVAMDKTAQASGIGQKNKLDMISFAFEKYYLSSSSTVAADSATSGVVKVPAGQLSCVQTLFDKYYLSLPSKNAMDKALQGCWE